MTGEFISPFGFYIHGDRVMLVTNDNPLTDEDGKHPGMKIARDGHNLRSADLAPGDHNRVVRAFGAIGQSAPPLAPLVSRKLSDRPKVIADARRAAGEVPVAADLAVFGWRKCEACGCVIAGKHHVCVATPPATERRHLDESERVAAVAEAIRAGHMTAGSVRRYLNDEGMESDLGWITPLLALKSDQVDADD